MRLTAGGALVALKLISVEPVNKSKILPVYIYHTKRFLVPVK
jgi:hypothetical protein